MNHKKVVAAAIIALPLLTTGCSSVIKQVDPSGVARISADSNHIVNRPVEYGMKTIGEASGEASVTKFLGFTIEGDKIKTDVKSIGSSSSDPLVKMAAFRAVKSKNGDAFYELRKEESKSGFGPFFSKRHVKVTGKVLSINELGILSAARADQRNKAVIEAGGQEKMSGGQKKGFFW